MSTYVSKLKSAATNPAAVSGVRDRALARLKEISLDGSDKRQSDAERVFRELTGRVSSAIPLEEDSDNSPATPTSGAWGDIGALTAPQEQINGRLASLIAECDKETRKSNVYRYYLPAIFREFVHSNPSHVGELTRKAANAALDKFLPYLWLTRPMFEEIQNALAMDDRQPYAEEYKRSRQRAAALVPRWKRMKDDWHSVNGPARVNICDLLFDVETDFQVSERRAEV